MRGAMPSSPAATRWPRVAEAPVAVDGVVIPDSE
jgi:hypothetical protein